MVVSDFDGTLATSDNKISQNNLDAINSFIKRGGLFAVCTGRATPGIIPCLKQAGYKGYFASYNGAVITDMDSGKVVLKKCIPNETCVKLLKLSEKYGFNAQTYPNDVLTVKSINKRVEWYLKFNSALTTKVVDPLSDYFIKTGYDSPKLLINDEKTKLDEVYEIVKNELTECQVIYADDNLIEITLKGITKACAVDNLAKINGLTVDDVIAVGDAGNDVPMIQRAGLGVAVSNAADYVKNNAKIIAPSNYEDAIKYIIENYCV